MKLIAGLIIFTFVASLAWGFWAGAQPAAPRPQDMTIQVDQAWYDALPADPAAAAQAYLDRVPQRMRARGEAVSQTRYWVFSAHVLMTIAAGALFMFSGAAAALRGWVTKRTSNQHLQVALYAAIFLAALLLLMMPLDVYRYARARHFGFADQPFAGWLSDWAIGWAVDTVFYVVGFVAIYALMRRFTRSWPLWAGAVYGVLVAIFVLLSPALIEPLFNKMTPLRDGALKEEILSLARANNVPVSEIVTSDASRQSRLFNAHVSGLGGAARITLNDTTMNGVSAAQIRWVMGHEIGHYVMGHIAQSIVISALAVAFSLALITLAMRALTKRFGGRWSADAITDPALLPLLWCLFLLWGDIAAPITNAYTRAQETAADIYGLNASQAPNGMAEVCIHDADTARLTPTPLDILLFYDHPSDKARVEMAMRWRAEQIRHGGSEKSGEKL